MYTYDGLFLEEILEQMWENESIWVDNQRTTYTEAGNNYPADRLEEGWDLVNWTNQRYSQYTYDVDWNEIEDYEQEWINGDWVNFETHFYTYDDGMMIERLTHRWETTRNWVNYHKQTMTYGTLDSEENTISPINDLLLTNYPNPFNPITTIYFSLNTEISENTELVIYNLKGQIIKKLAVSLSGVEGSASWNGTDNDNKPVSSGIYFYKLTTDNLEATKKMILMK
ncbi:MAG: T9SS type A sorting domain-containing protein [Candidatus Cloacimonetes bacterium]|nr:T9SS type A sorting domain-containing protein [Candidatus Cloacimonadota bacterium]